MLDRVPTSRTAQAPWMAVLLLSVLAATSRAQTIEITPVAGYRIGGGNVNTNAQGEFEPGDGFELDDSFSASAHATAARRARLVRRDAFHSLGVGTRVRLTDSVGLRLESRWFAAVFGNGDEQYSGPGAMGPGTSQLLSQLDLRAGLSLRF